MIGVQLGEWIIDCEIGHGPWGVVYRVRHHQDANRVMALKLLTDARTTLASFHVRFQAEMAILRRLDHPHIVKYYDHGLHENHPYYVMDHVEGSGYDRRQRVPWEEVLTISIQIISALRYAHRRGVLHRSLKPANILEFGPGQIKVSDFGIAKLFTESAGSTQPLVPETVYGSPEQFAGRSLSKRSDFYSLGTLLYTLLVGRPPFNGATFVEVVQKVCFTLPERPIHYLPDLPEEIDSLVIKLLAKEPGQRPGSGTLLLRELERIWSDLERKQKVGKRPEFPPPGSDADVNLEAEVDATPSEEDSDPAPVRENPTHQLIRGFFLFAALLTITGVLIWAFFLRHESAETLINAARPLLQSDNPDDWVRAWDEHVSELARRHPTEYSSEVREARFRAERVRELRNSSIYTKLRQPSSEAERFYDEGLRLSQAGDIPAARKKWRNLIAIFRGESGEERWVFAAELGLKLVVEKTPEKGMDGAALQRAREEMRRCITRLRELRAEGDRARAADLIRSLTELYQGHPAFEEFRPELESE